jgi:hypothetical protein
VSGEKNGPAKSGCSRRKFCLEFWRHVDAQRDLAKSAPPRAPFRDLAEGEFIKTMCVRNG